MLVIVWVTTKNRKNVGRQNFIEINGKKYDALTGKLMQTPESAANQPAKAVKLMPNSIGVVDGFVKPPRKTSHTSTVHPFVKNPQRSQTLMRKAVQKPNTTTTPKAQPKATFTKNKLGSSQQRVQNAQTVKRSPQIQKYGNTTSVAAITRMQPAKNKPQSISSPKIVAEEQRTRSASRPAQQTPHRSAASKKIIEAALANANSHNQPQVKLHKTKKRSRLAKKLGISTKMLTLSSASLAVVLLVGFFAVQNVPNVSMKVASTRAGLDARMPGYKPSGFSFRGPINYSPGRVSVAYASNSDDREFEIVQSNSNWNSDALLSNFVVAEGKQYQTYQDRGRTLYIYDGSNATWVDNGIWYQIDGNSDMTTDQLIRIAASI